MVGTIWSGLELSDLKWLMTVDLPLLSNPTMRIWAWRFFTPNRMAKSPKNPMLWRYLIATATDCRNPVADGAAVVWFGVGATGHVANGDVTCAVASIDSSFGRTRWPPYQHRWPSPVKIKQKRTSPRRNLPSKHRVADKRWSGHGKMDVSQFYQELLSPKTVLQQIDARGGRRQWRKSLLGRHTKKAVAAKIRGVTLPESARNWSEWAGAASAISSWFWKWKKTTASSLPRNATITQNSVEIPRHSIICWCVPATSVNRPTILKITWPCDRGFLPSIARPLPLLLLSVMLPTRSTPRPAYCLSPRDLGSH